MVTTLWEWAAVGDAAATGDAGSAARSFSIPVALRLDPHRIGQHATFGVRCGTQADNLW
jgi:hypothetical protein